MTPIRRFLQAWREAANPSFPTHGLHSPARMQQLLSRERMRSDRGDSIFSLLTFSNAVPLRERIAGMRPEHPVVSATVVGAGVAAAGLVWYAARRRTARG